MTERIVTLVDVTLQEGQRFEARNAIGATAILDAYPPGGEGKGLTPMEFLLAGLGACTGMDAIGILRKKRQPVTGYRIEIAGVKADEHPKIFTEITVRHIFTGSNLTEGAVRQAIELSEEKYCSVMAMLRKSASISTSFEINSAP
jgi:putative redox protein